MVTLQMYVCFSFQDTEFNSLLFEYELALITCLSNRMQQTCFGNSEARSLKQCVLFILGCSLLEPDFHAVRSLIHMERPGGALWLTT